MPKKKVVVLGAGLAGLSAAYHLKEDARFEASVFEKSGSVGGTARSITVDGFTFDFTGHLLHLHHDYTKKLIRDLLGDNLYSCVRNAAIYSHGKTTPYPFQANTYGLPRKVVNDCVEGFREAVQKYADDKTRPTSLAFEDWSKRTFGRGIHRHFMKPYNEKLWQVKTAEMTAEWCGMFVPQPKLEDVVAGSKRRPKKAFGYNTTFLYPKRGGIQVLPEALAEGLEVRTETPFEEVDWKRKRVRLSTGEWRDYDFLVNSAPLAELLNRMTDLPEDIAKTLPKLKWTSVLCINLGVRRSKISDKSWIYFPEKKYRFYRVGFPMNFTPHVAPKGCSSMYVEVGYPPEKKLHLRKDSILKRVLKDLVVSGILKKSDEIATTCVIPIPYAYVVYTPERKALTEKIFKFLQDHQIYSIGRYGAWKYSFMEEAILDGKKTAETIRGLVS